MTPSMIITDSDWSYEYQNKTYTEAGEWVHLPMNEAGSILLYMSTINKFK